MNTTIPGHYLRARVVMALLAVLVVLSVALVFALQPAPTTSDPAMSAGGKGGSSLTEDPHLESHAAVVQHLGNGSLR